MIDPLFSASCCSSSASEAGIIKGNSTWRFGFSGSQKTYLGRSQEFGHSSSYAQDKSEWAQSLAITHAINHRLQWGASGNLGVTSSDKWLLGDTQVFFSYGVLRNERYSRFRPEVFLSAKAQLGTGHSFYDDRQESFGEGLNKAGLSVDVFRNYRQWNYSLSSGFFLSEKRRFKIASVNRSWENRSTLSVGFSPTQNPDWRFGLSQAFNYKSSRKIKDHQSKSTQSSLAHYSFPTGFSIAYLLRDEWTISMGYNSNRIFPSQNSEEYSEISASFTYRILP